MSNRNIILNAIGKEDDYLTKNPVITFLKSEYKKHTNFSKNIIKVCSTSNRNDIINYNFGELVHFEIDKSGDLLLNLSVEITIEGDDWNSNNLVVPQTIYSLIDYIEILADTKVLERLRGEWIYIWHQLYGRNNSDNNIYDSAYASNNNLFNSKHKLLLKIPFWFSLNAGLALPLWAIQHERIHIRLKLKNKSEICLESENRNIVIKNIELILEIVDLDKLEKDKFQNNQLEYLIEQVEFCGSNIIESNFNSRKKIEIERFPYVTEIYWIFSGIDFENNASNKFNPNNYFNYWLNFDGNPLTRLDHTKNTTILLNGNPINQRLKGSYYRKIPRYESHNTVSSKDKFGNSIKEPNIHSYNCIYTYSFSFNPQNIKPSGFLSTNKFNSMHLDIELNKADYNRNLNIYIKRFNIIRINNGYINLVHT